MQVVGGQPSLAATHLGSRPAIRAHGMDLIPGISRAKSQVSNQFVKIKFSHLDAIAWCYVSEIPDMASSLSKLKTSLWFTQSYERTPEVSEMSVPLVPQIAWENFNRLERSLFGLLIIPVIINILLLVSDQRHWLISGDSYTMIDQNRTSLQIAIHIISTILGAIQAFAICRLINLATRISFTRRPISLNDLGFWTAISTPTVNWNLPFGMIILCLVISNICAVISALWTGAMTPTITTGSRMATVMIPSWENTSLIVEYPSQIDRTGPSVRSPKGYFTYSVGLGLLASLVSSASSATTVDGGVRTHAKLDYTGYSYYGRSYGVGATAGLLDDLVLDVPRATNYSYQEIGYDTSVSCRYNHSAQFSLSEVDSGDNSFPAVGFLPDSVADAGEYSTYIGYGESAIVAIGVSRTPIKERTRYLGIAAGSSYDFLNLTQCAVHFTPTLFNVTVTVESRNITVEKADVGGEVPFIDPSFMTIHVIMRQFELISNDLTSMYRSTLGDAFNSSISDYWTSVSNKSTETPSQENVTLAGLENAVISLVDDILVGYGSAQLMVGEFKQQTNATVQIPTYRLGSSWYIITITCVNAVIVLSVAVEYIRTGGWKDLPPFDYLDNRSIIISTSNGGSAIGNYVNSTRKDIGKVPVILKETDKEHESLQLTLAEHSVLDCKYKP